MIFLQIIGIILAIILSIALVYSLLTLLGSIVPVNSDFKPTAQGVEIGLTSNGVHMDFILPVVNHLFDWRTLMDSKDYEIPLNENTYLGFGWGDRGFYLDIPTWADLTLKIAFTAVLMPSKTLMHITAHESVCPQGDNTSQSFFISEEQYLKLCNYIIPYFVQDKQGKVKHLPGKGYTSNDNFYHAVGYYHAFYTCNYWINRGLKKIGVRTALWSPLDRGIFYQLQKV